MGMGYQESARIRLRASASGRLGRTENQHHYGVNILGLF